MSLEGGKLLVVSSMCACRSMCVFVERRVSTSGSQRLPKKNSMDGRGTCLKTTVLAVGWRVNMQLSKTENELEIRTCLCKMLN